MAERPMNEWMEEQVIAALRSLGLRVSKVPEEELKGLPRVYYGPARSVNGMRRTGAIRSPSARTSNRS
jgi:hypothetical protein